MRPKIRIRITTLNNLPGGPSQDTPYFVYKFQVNQLEQMDIKTNIRSRFTLNKITAKRGKNYIDHIIKSCIFIRIIHQI